MPYKKLPNIGDTVTVYDGGPTTYTGVVTRHADPPCPGYPSTVFWYRVVTANGRKVTNGPSDYPLDITGHVNDLIG